MKRKIIAVLCAVVLLICSPASYATVVFVAAGQIRIQPGEHGTLIASRITAQKGDLVRLTPDPDEGYVIDQAIVKDTDGAIVPVRRWSNDSFLFTMPGGAVTVTATFMLVDATAAGAAALPFKDVAKADWYHQAVCYLYGRKLVSGVTETEFAPNQEISMAMLLTILHRACGEPAPQNAVSGDSWYATPMQWAKEKRIYVDAGDLYGPDDRIPREFVVTLLYRCAKSDGRNVDKGAELTRFADGGTVSRYATDAMRWAVGSGIIKGGDNGLNPHGFITRAEAAVVLQRFCSEILLLDGVG